MKQKSCLLSDQTCILLSTKFWCGSRWRDISSIFVSILLDKFTAPRIFKEHINPLSLRNRPNLHSESPSSMAVPRPHRDCMAMSPVTRKCRQSLGNLTSSSWSHLSNNTRRSVYDLWSYCMCVGGPCVMRARINSVSDVYFGFGL